MSALAWHVQQLRASGLSHLAALLTEVSQGGEAERPSKVYLVGAGPGDPELLTIKALRTLRKAEVVLYDRLVTPDVLGLANPAAELVYVGKGEGEQEQVQERILAFLLAYAHQGRTVVRLKGGDPLVFGRGGEEWHFLSAHGIEVEFIPGITSAVAVPGVAGIPLTLRGVSSAFTVIAGHRRGGAMPDWSRYAGTDTLVILMGVKHRAAIARGLIEAGRDPNEAVAFIERGTTLAERVVPTTLAAVAAGNVEVNSPAVFVVGAVVKRRESLVSISDAVRDVAHVAR